MVQNQTCCLTEEFFSLHTNTKQNSIWNLLRLQLSLFIGGEKKHDAHEHSE